MFTSPLPSALLSQAMRVASNIHDCHALWGNGNIWLSLAPRMHNASTRVGKPAAGMWVFETLDVAGSTQNPDEPLDARRDPSSIVDALEQRSSSRVPSRVAKLSGVYSSSGRIRAAFRTFATEFAR